MSAGVLMTRAAQGVAEIGRCDGRITVCYIDAAGRSLRHPAHDATIGTGSGSGFDRSGCRTGGAVGDGRG
jgi:hypothetical protein